MKNVILFMAIALLASCDRPITFDTTTGERELRIDLESGRYSWSSIHSGKSKSGRFVDCGGHDDFCVVGSPFLFSIERSKFTDEVKKNRRWSTSSSDKDRECNFELIGPNLISFECRYYEDQVSPRYYIRRMSADRSDIRKFIK